MDLLLLWFYCNDNCDVGSHKKYNKSTCVDKSLHCTGHDDGLIKPKHVASASKRESKLCFNWWLIYFFFIKLLHNGMCSMNFNTNLRNQLQGVG